MKKEQIITSPLIQEYENQAKRGRALDLGAGRGNNALFLAQQGFNVTAVEIRENLVEIIKERAKENGIEVDVVSADFRNFEIEENCYAFISAMHSLNFVSKKEFYEMIKKIKSGLVDGGVCAMALFTNDDPLFQGVKLNAAEEEERSFRNDTGRKWYFPKPNELREIFEHDFEILFYVEAVVEDNGHLGDPEPHKHSVVRIVVRKI